MIHLDDALTEYLWPIVREMVKTAIENQQNLIVEGCYVPAEWRRDFDVEYLSEIHFVCLALSDGYIDENFSYPIESAPSGDTSNIHGRGNTSSRAGGTSKTFRSGILFVSM